MKTTIKDLVRAAVAWRDPDPKVDIQEIRIRVLHAAASIDTSMEVVLSRATVEAALHALGAVALCEEQHRGAPNAALAWMKHRRDIEAALKEQS